ncbi:MAG: hypothetical protein P4L53_07635 [Candidatus Obscuribacterales bacterium]|nr:hypothetical protein [Candidatus Obscuribacterales bacterium]
MPSKTSTIALFVSLVSSLMLNCAMPSWSAPVELHSDMSDSPPIISGESSSMTIDQQQIPYDELTKDSHNDDVMRYPLVYWRQWSNRKLPPFRVLIFMLGLVSSVQLLLGSQLDAARVIYDKQRLRMFGIGALISVLGCVVAGFLYRLELFAPLAGLLIALVQLFNLFGLTVAAQSMGIGLLKLLKLGQWQQTSKLGLLVRVWVGAFLLSLMVLIPRIGALPPVGNRLLCLFAVAGSGATLALIKRGKDSPNI